jgi:uncharacterized protein (TIGR02444 family)
MESLWDFSLRVWPRVERACLALQDEHGADVNLLLLCCWLGAAGRGADLERAMAVVAPWRRDVLGPIRAARRAIPREAPEELGGRVRAGLARVELEAERVEQLLLAPCAAGARRSTAAENLDRYLRLIGAPPEDGRARALLEATACS